VRQVSVFQADRASHRCHRCYCLPIPCYAEKDTLLTAAGKSRLSLCNKWVIGEGLPTGAPFLADIACKLVFIREFYPETGS